MKRATDCWVAQIADRLLTMLDKAAAEATESKTEAPLSPSGALHALRHGVRRQPDAGVFQQASKRRLLEVTSMPQ